MRKCSQVQEYKSVTQSMKIHYHVHCQVYGKTKTQTLQTNSFSCSAKDLAS